MKIAFYHLKFTYILLLLLSCYAVADENTGQQPLNNCDLVVIDYQDNPEMTRVEKLERMRQAFDASMHKFEDCHMSLSSASKNSGSGSDAGAAAGAGAESDSESGSANSSTASANGTSISNTELQGTEAENTDSSNAADSAANEAQGESSEIDSAGRTSNGAVPEDIPPAENDDALAAQIRVAAEAESDPETRKKLWNEYRKYKGINIEQ